MLARILARLKEDFHIPIGLLVFLITTVYHFKTRVDLGPQYTNSIYALYAFLGGHSWVTRNGSGDDSSK